MVDVTVLLTMPRVDASVPLTRRVATGCLNAVGVPVDDVDAIVLALTEACTNVLRHGAGTADYDVVIWVEPVRAVIEITEQGDSPTGTVAERDLYSLEPAAGPAGVAGSSGPAGPDLVDVAENGRGLQLMRAVMDELSVSGQVGGGTVLRMVRSLQPSPGSPLLRLSA